MTDEERAGKKDTFPRSTTITKHLSPRFMIDESASRHSLSKTLLKNGPNNLSILVLKSLKLGLSSLEYKKLITADQGFKQRWLYDEIIDSFCWVLAKEIPGVLACPTLVTAALARRHQNALRIDRLWSDDPLDDTKIILAPWNPRGNHWVLVSIFKFR
eukprot:gene779-70_t